MILPPRPLAALLPFLAIALSALPLRAEIVPVKVNRWLDVSQATGTVLYHSGTSHRAAKLGDRLQAVGDELTTGPQSSATLSFDSKIGIISVGANTRLRVQELAVAADGGRISRLNVIRGRVRLQVRRFTRPSSRLEIQTPAGVSGVRGTDFGVSIQPDGKTSVATLEGRVAVAAQAQEVEVNPGFQTFVIPGEPPTPPAPLTEDTRLYLEVLQRVDWQHVRIAGRVDRTSLISLEDQPLVTDRWGQFDTIMTLPIRSGIQATIVTPLGKQQVYEIAIP